MNPLKLSVPLPDVLHEIDGDIRVKGSRISLYDIIYAYNQRWMGPHAMVFHYPTLSLYEIEKVLEFYQANRDVVEREYIAECNARMEEILATGKRVPIEEYRRRFEAMKAKRVEANGAANAAPNVTMSPPTTPVN